MIGRSARSIVLQFDSALDVLPTGKRLSQGMSAVVAVEDTLWLAHDETVSVEALRATATARSLRYTHHRRFDLRNFIDLPVPGTGSGGATPPEADFEGLSFCGDYLWIVGSHSAARQGLKPRAAQHGDALRPSRAAG